MIWRKSHEHEQEQTEPQEESGQESEPEHQQKEEAVPAAAAKRVQERDDRIRKAVKLIKEKLDPHDPNVEEIIKVLTTRGELHE